MTEERQRVEDARAAILASGDRDLINRLHLLDAAKGDPEKALGRGGGPSLLGTGLAVAGGMVLGNLLAGMTLSRDMEAAFATLAADAGLQPHDLGLCATEAVALAGTAEEGLLGDLGLGDLGIGDIGLEDFFDI